MILNNMSHNCRIQISIRFSFDSFVSNPAIYGYKYGTILNGWLISILLRIIFNNHLNYIDV